MLPLPACRRHPAPTPWSSALALTLVIGRRDRVGGVLPMPYLLWVSYASFLNLTIVALNAPFAGR